MNVSQIIRDSGQSIDIQGPPHFSILHPSIIKISSSPDNIKQVLREGNNLIVTLHSGEVISIDNFFSSNSAINSELVFVDAESGEQWRAVYSEPFDGVKFESIESIDDLLITTDSPSWAAIGLGLATLAGIGGILLASGGSGHSGGHSEPAQDDKQPSILTVDANNMHGLRGYADPGMTVKLTLPDGRVVTTIADAKGAWHFNPNPLSDGQQGAVSVSDDRGHTLGPIDTGVADVTPPTDPEVTLNNTNILEGSAEAGSTVVLKRADGSTITTIADSHGHWAFEPNPLSVGESASLVVIDPAGNSSGYLNTGACVGVTPSAPTIDHNNGDILEGTGEPGSTVIVEREDGSTVTTIVDEDGHWSFEPNPLEDGEQGSIVIVDPNGNASEPVHTDPTDKTPPAPGAVDHNNGDSLDGTGEPGSTVIVEREDGSTVTTIVDEDGRWSFEPNPLEDGEQGSIVIVDPNGNASEPVHTDPADKTPPAPGAVDHNNGDVLDGTGEPGSTVIVEREDGSTVTTIVDEDGRWSFEPNPLEDGEQGSIVIVDPNGNASEPTHTDPADKTPPAPGAVDHNNGDSLDGTGEPGSTVIVEREDGSTVTTIVDEDGRWSFEPNPLEDGEQGSIVIVDPNGNASEPVHTDPADKTPPAPGAVDHNNGDVLDGTGEPGSTVIVEREDGSTVTTIVDEDGRWSFEPNPLEDGEQGSIVIVDPNGNASEPTHTDPADKTPPAPGIVDHNNGDVLDGSGEPGSTVIVEREDGSTVTTIVDEDGRWSFEPNPLEDGEQGSIVIVDPNGNASEPTHTDPADKTPPAPGAVDHNNGDVLDGTGEPGSTVIVEREDGSTVTTIVDEDGRWSFEPNPLEDGEQGSIVIVDPNGNASEPVHTDPTDKTPPAPGAVDHNNGDVLDGTGEPGSTVIVEREDGSTVTTIVDEDGHWSFEPNPLEDGEQGSIVIVDPNGNASEPTHTDPADKTPPAPGAVDHNNGDVLDGTGEPGSTVIVEREDGSTVTTIVDEDGRWSFEPNPLEDGEQGSIVIVDPNGNASEPVHTDPTDKTPPAPGAVDHNNGDVLDGTGEPGSTVIVEREDGSTVTTIVDEDGRWSFEPNPLEDGEQGSIVIVDPNGNASEPTHTDPADKTPPAPGAVDHNNGDVLDGTGEPGSTVIVEREDGSTVTTIVDEDGRWSFEPNPLEDGEQGSIVIVDPNGNASEPTHTDPADKTPPAPGAVDHNNGDSLDGTGEPGSTVIVEREDGSTVTTIVDEDGRWSFEPNPLEDGEQGSIVIVDPNGNASEPVHTDPTDKTPPAPGAVDHNNGDVLDGTGEPGSTVIVEREDGSTVTTIVDEDGRWSFEPNPLEDGEQGSIVIVDPNGNVSEPVHTDPADKTPPAPGAVDHNNGDVLDGTGEPGSTVIVEREDGSTVTTIVDEDGRWSFEPNPLEDGEQGSIVIVDPNGNASEPVHTDPADKTPPAPGAVDHNNGDVLDGTGEPGSTVIVEREDGSTVTTIVDEDGRWSFEPNPLEDGEQGSIVIVDPNGNASEPTHTDPADKTPPAPGAVDHNNGDVLDGTGEPGSTVIVEREDGSTVTTIVDEDGRWSFEPNPLEDGEQGSIVIVDPNGNASEPTHTDPADKTPPAPGAVDHNNGDVLDGTGEPGSTVIVEREDGSTVTTIVDEDGRWSFEPNPLEDGEQGSIVIVDPNGNASEPTHTDPADKTPPAPGAVDHNNGDSLEGTGEPGSTVIVEREDGSTVTTIVDEDGRWSFEPNPLEDGEQGSIVIVDPNGNATEPTHTDPADKTPPAPGAVDHNNGDVLDGTGEPGSTVIVEREDGSTVTTIVDEDGRWSFEPNPLEDGEQGSIVIVDPNGNASEPVHTDPADKTPPAPGIVDHNNGDVLDGSGEPGSTVIVEREDGSTVTTIVDEDGRWSFEPNPLEDGEQGSIVIVDPNGNASEPTHTDPADKTPPAPGAVDHNNGDVLDGTGEPGSTVIVEREDGSTVTTIVDEDGRWSFEPNPLEDGEQGSIVIVDPNGNASEPTHTDPADKTPPAQPEIAAIHDDRGLITGNLPDYSVTDDTQPALIGKAEAGSTVIIYQDEQIIGSVVANANGDWSFTPETTLADGQHLFHVTATDKAGNVSETSDIFTVVVKTDAPAPIDEATLGLNDDVGLITGEIDKGDVTDDRRPTFSGQVAPGSASIVKVYDNGVLIGSSVVDSEGNWSFTPVTPLAPGSHSFQAEPVDVAGNVGDKTTAWNFTLLGDAPAAPAITRVVDDAGTVTSNLQKGDLTDDRTLTVGGTGVADTVVTVFVNGDAVGSVVVDNYGNWELTTDALSGDGEKKITAQAMDKAGQQSAMTGEYTVILDTTAPNVPAAPIAHDDQGAQQTAIGNGDTTDDTQPEFSGKDAEADAIVRVYDNGTLIGSTIVDAQGNWSFTPTVALESGRHAVVIELVDKAGNVSNASDELNFIVDTSNVDVTISNVMDNYGTITGTIANHGTTDDTTPTLQGSATAGTIVTIKEGTIVLGSAVADTEGNWSLELPVQTEGDHTYTASVIGRNGTEASANISINIDTTAPAVPTIVAVMDDVGGIQGEVSSKASSDDTTPTLQGSGEAGSVVKIYDNGDFLGSVQVNASGEWSYTSLALSEGNHKLTVTAVDKVGNESAPSAAFELNVDTSAPMAQVTIERISDDTGTPGDFITSGQTQSILGTLSNVLGTDEKLQISVDGGQSWIDVTSVNGINWRYDEPRTLTDGQYEYQVRVIDAAGNVGSQVAQVVTIDTGLAIEIAVTSITPDTGVEGDFVTNSNFVTLNGTLSQTLPGGAKLQITRDGGTSWQEVAVKSDGSWVYVDQNQYSSSVTLNYELRVLTAGGDIAGSTSQQVAIDLDKPTSRAVIDSLENDSGASDADFLTNENQVVINGSINGEVRQGDFVQVSLDSGNTWQSADIIDGKWVMDLSQTALADGTYTLLSRVVSGGGNVGANSSQVIAIDTSGQDLGGITSTFAISTDTGIEFKGNYSTAETAVNDDMITRDSTLTFSGDLSKGLQLNQHLQISWDNGQTWVNVLSHSGMHWSYNLPELLESQKLDVQLRVIDTAGNVATGTEFSDYRVVIDLDAPATINSAPEVARSIEVDTVLSFDSEQYGSVEAGARIALIDDVNGNGTYQEGLDRVIGYATADESGQWRINTMLSGGSYHLGFVVWDAAGNGSAMSPTIAVSAIEGVNEANSKLIETTWGGTTDSDDFGLNSAAVTINANGSLSFFQSSRDNKSTATANAGYVYNQVDGDNYDATYLAQASNMTDKGYGRFVAQATFADYNRDGHADIFGQVSSNNNYSGVVGFGEKYRTSLWTSDGEGGYTSSGLTIGKGWTQLGGVVAFDMEGDGYLDFAMANSEFRNMILIKNAKGTLEGSEDKNVKFSHEISAVDVNNNGSVDLVGHTDYNSGRGMGVLLNNGSSFNQSFNYNSIFPNNGELDFGNLPQSLTWADFNGDGYLDLFVSRGVSSDNKYIDEQSRVYLNKGNDANGIWQGMDTNAPLFVNDQMTNGSFLDGGASLAVDWNGDGKMDVVEVPRQNIKNSSAKEGSPLVMINNGSSGWEGQSLTGDRTFNNITGAAAVDYDWDGAVDVILYRAGADNAGQVTNSAPSLLVKNQNVIEEGTSLNLRILDKNGLNVFYSNTVQLYNSKNELVATQIINPQSSATTDSQGIVRFYGLDPNEVYSVSLLRLENGSANHVGAIAQQGGHTNSTLNASWGGLKPGAATDGYVLQAETLDAENNSIGSGGVVGSGYNDTFFSSAGDDTYTGGGGWNVSPSGEKVWSATQGMDVVDYSRADANINANLASGQAVGAGNDTLNSIEGLIGGRFADTFTGNAADNRLEGRGGDDVFYLSTTNPAGQEIGGHDSLIYRLLDKADATGGNGSDRVHGFTVGNVMTDKNADIIDISELLNYSGNANVYKDGNELKLDASSKELLDYVKVDVVGNDTVISVDLDGTGGEFGFSNMITLNDVKTDLLTLLHNNQLIV